MRNDTGIEEPSITVCMTESRAKLLGIWFPIQLLSAAVVGYLVYQTFYLDLGDALGYRKAHRIYLHAIGTQTYFVFALVKDFAIFLYFMIWGEEVED